jgi:hypothetical protein
MKTLKALKHLFLGYKLHPKEQDRLMDLWHNVKSILITIIITAFIIWLVSMSGCFERQVTPEDFN